MGDKLAAGVGAEERGETRIDVRFCLPPRWRGRDLTAFARPTELPLGGRDPTAGSRPVSGPLLRA